MTKLTTQETKALALLETIRNRTDAYYKVNKDLQKLQGDFNAHVQLIDIHIETQLVDLLDNILGDELASYYLFEVSSMKEGGLIVPRRKRHPTLEYRIKTIKDVKTYLIDRRVTRNFTRNLKLILNKS